MMNCFLVPESSYQLKATLTRIQELGSSELFVDSHLIAVAKTITAICVAAFDTVSYTGKALTGCFIAIIELDFSKSLEEFVSNSSDAVRSLSMIVILTGCAVSGIFMPGTVLGNFPTFLPPEDFQSQFQSAQVQLGQLPALQHQLSQAEIRLGEFDRLSQELQSVRAELAELKRPFIRPSAEERKTVQPPDLKGLEIRTRALLMEITERKRLLILVNNGIEAAQDAITNLQGKPETFIVLTAEILALCQEAGEIKKPEFSSSLSQQEKREALHTGTKNLEALSFRMKASLKKGRAAVDSLKKELQTLKA